MNVLGHWSDDAVNRVADRLRQRGRSLPVNADTVRLVVHEAEAVPADQLAGAVSLAALREIAREMYDGLEVGSPEQLAVSEFLGRAESLGGGSQ